jgi:hypothetical protein
MKKTMKLMSIIMLGCMTVLMMASCLSGDDNDSQDTEWQEWINGVKTQITASRGDYTGYIYYQPQVASQEVDSVAAEWTIINDSAVVLRHVPTSLLVDKLPVRLSAVKEAVSAIGTVGIDVGIVFSAYYQSPIVFSVSPAPVTLKVMVDGQEKTVVIHFHDYDSNSSSYGQFLMSNSNCLIKVYLKDVVVDGNLEVSYSSADYAFLYWLGKKR